MSNEKVILILGSEKDIDFVQPAISLLEEFGLDHDTRIASAHKTPGRLMDILEEYDGEENLVFITVAGRSNALSGFVDANSRFPVIACPPYSDKYGGADIFSSLRMPSGVAPLVVLDPKGAVLAACKILGLQNSDLSDSVESYQDNIRDKVVKGDVDTRSN